MGQHEVVPASTAIKTKSMKNVDADRLVRRLEFLRDHLAWPFNHDSADGRASFGDRVREVINIERELTRREVEFALVTDGKHLAIDVYAVPVCGPRPSKKEREAEKAKKASVSVS